MIAQPEVDFPFVATLPYAPSAARKLHLLKREHGIETHHCPGMKLSGAGPDWMAAWMVGSRRFGYGVTPESSLFDCVALVGRLMDEAGYTAYADTEREAVEQLLEQI